MNKENIITFLQDRITELDDYRKRCYRKYCKVDKRTLDAKRLMLKHHYYSGCIEELYHILQVVNIEVKKDV